VSARGKFPRAAVPAPLIERHRYQHVVCWFDKGERAREVAKALPKAIPMKSPQGKDANDVLVAFGEGGLRRLIEFHIKDGTPSGGDPGRTRKPKLMMNLDQRLAEIRDINSRMREAQRRYATAPQHSRSATPKRTRSRNWSRTTRPNGRTPEPRAMALGGGAPMPPGNLEPRILDSSC